MFIKDKLLVYEIDEDMWWKNLPNKERLQLMNYKGIQFMYNFWPLIEKHQQLFKIENELADYTSFSNVLQYYNAIQPQMNKKVYLALLNESNTVNEYKNFDFIGFEVLKLLEHGQPMFFSSIINELRYNGNEFIKGFVNDLNQYYLFDEYNSCKQYLKKREEAIIHNEKKYLEYGIPSSDFQILQIHQYVTR